MLSKDVCSMVNRIDNKCINWICRLGSGGHVAERLYQIFNLLPVGTMQWQEARRPAHKDKGLVSA